ncbi:MAG: acyl-CoA/acyl-ACP dehydrogenase, partial [Mangrovicoccus sp.]|nr:acyl-CoA/acyl-ACP dehydrogenase [Mangrovicoccus sp.]
MTFQGADTAQADNARLYIDRAATLSERIAVKPGPGRDKAHCDALLAEMRRSHLLAVCVPQRLGGPELDVGAIAAITHEIARQSGSAGLVYAMHMSQALSLSVHAAATPWFDALQRRMLADQLLIASGTSEKGPGGDILTSVCCIEPDGDDRLKVVKESPNVSYVDHADLILVTANQIGAGGRKKQVLIAAEVDRAAFEMDRNMSLLGMRGILNGPWTFTIRFAPEAIFAADFGAIARQTMTPSIHIFWSALWSGIVWTALDRTRRFVTAETDPAGGTGQVAQYELTRLVDRHHMMNALIRQAIASYETREQATD